jgi:uncharacterized membrane protein YsdA (DUF1294 family)
MQRLNAICHGAGSLLITPPNELRIIALCWLLLVNAAAFALFWLDKRAARAGGRRAKESTLLLAAFLGGSPAALLAMRLFRHKTRKVSFRLRLWILLCVQALAVAVACFLHGPG